MPENSCVSTIVIKKNFTATENKLKMYHIHKIQSMIVPAAVPKLTHPNSLYHLKGSSDTIILKARCSCLVPVVMKS